MYFIIGADMVPTTSNTHLFSKGNVEILVGKEIWENLEQASYRIFNLEVPLTDFSYPIDKQGPNLIASTTTITTYKKLNLDLLTLANNHILDQGAEGLFSTINTLDNAGINHIGAGANIAEASKPLFFSFAEKKIGVYGCTEHEFSIADQNRSGANPFDPLYSLDHVEKLKKQCEFVIVLYHGGKENYRYPSPNLQKVCRRLVDKGADLVICQHSHCIGCQEKYKTGTIVYGQGNFLFDNSNSEYWKTSLLISVNNDFTISYIPLVKVKNTVRIADKKQSKKILDDFYLRSEEIKTEGFIEQKYKELAEGFIDIYLNALAGKRTRLFRLIDKLTGGKYKEARVNLTYDIKSTIKIENYINCEAHRELILEGLRLKRK